MAVQKLLRLLIQGQNGKISSNEIYMATKRYFLSFNSENFTDFACIYVELRLVKDTHIAVPGHASDVMSVLLFIQQPYLSCLPRLFALRLKKPMLELHTLIQTKFSGNIHIYCWCKGVFFNFQWRYLAQYLLGIQKTTPAPQWRHYG